MARKTGVFHIDLYTTQLKRQEIALLAGTYQFTIGELIRRSLTLYRLLAAPLQAETYRGGLRSNLSMITFPLVLKKMPSEIHVASFRGAQGVLLNGEMQAKRHGGVHIDIVFTENAKQDIDEEKPWLGVDTRGKVLLAAFNFAQFLRSHAHDYDILKIEEEYSGETVTLLRMDSLLSFSEYS